jgi:hypothetical protein
LLFFVLFLLGGVGTVAASQQSLPGNVLYPIKRASEEARLAFEFFDEGKAQLRLSLAQRRANEVSTLFRAGKLEHVESAQRNLEQHLLKSTQIIAKLDNESEVARLRRKLDLTSIQALAKLQDALLTLPAEAQPIASNSLQFIGAAYTEAIETTASAAPSPAVTARAGTVQFYAIDPPEPEVEKLLIEVGKIEVQLVDGRETRWIPITEELQTFDLLQITQVQRFLGEGRVPTGTYTQVRFDVQKATIVSEGSEFPASIVNGQVTLKRPFKVEEGKTTTVFLDFEGARSLGLSDTGQYLLTPSIKLLVLELEQLVGLSQAGKPPSGITLEKAQVEGNVQDLDTGTLVVQGKRVAIAPETSIEGEIKLGQQVNVAVRILPDGGFLAVQVTVKGAEPGKKPEPGSPGETSPPGGGVPTATPEPPPGPSLLQLTGILGLIQPGRWALNGTELSITPATEIVGELLPGLRVQIVGRPQPDGTVVVVSLQVLQEARTPTPTPSNGGRVPELVKIEGVLTRVEGDRWTINGHRVIVTPGTTVEGVIALGARLELEGVRQPDGTIQATTIKLISPTPTGPVSPTLSPTPLPLPLPSPSPLPQLIDVEGTLEDIQGLFWRVSGTPIWLTEETSITGTPILGSRVRIRGVHQGTTIVATTITIEPRLSQTPERPTAVPPLPTLPPVISTPLATIVPTAP